MPKSIFISRYLEPHSPFTELKPTRTVIDISLLQFKTIKFEVLPASEWIFFYSQKGVFHFFDQVDPGQLSSRKIAAFGPKTAKALKEYPVPLHFIGTGYADETAPAFLLIAAGERAIFPRAKNSRKSMQKALRDKVDSIDLVVYDNLPKPDIVIPPCDILIFTSPLNAKTYFSHYEKLGHQQIVAIGRTTASTINELGIDNVIIPDNPTEEALANLVKQIDPQNDITT